MTPGSPCVRPPRLARLAAAGPRRKQSPGARLRLALGFAVVASLALAVRLALHAPEPPRRIAAPHPPHNPFARGHEGLRYPGEVVGECVLYPVDHEIVRVEVERVFREEGFRLRRDYLYNKDGVVFIADGYDPDHGVGYLYPDTGPGGPSFLKQDLPGSPIHRPSTQRAFAREALDFSSDDRTEMERRQERGKESVAVLASGNSNFLIYVWTQELWDALADARRLPDPARRRAAERAIRTRAARPAFDILEPALHEYLTWVRARKARPE